MGKQFGKARRSSRRARFGHHRRHRAEEGSIVGVATLPGGKIRFKGVVSLTSVPGPPLMVTGGTGRYARASGKVVIGPAGIPLNTYRLTLPV